MQHFICNGTKIMSFLIEAKNTSGMDTCSLLIISIFVRSCREQKHTILQFCHHNDLCC